MHALSPLQRHPYFAPMSQVCHGPPVVTALTVQNTKRVQAVRAVPPHLLTSGHALLKRDARRLSTLITELPRSLRPQARPYYCRTDIRCVPSRAMQTQMHGPSFRRPPSKTCCAWRALGPQAMLLEVGTGMCRAARCTYWILGPLPTQVLRLGISV